MQPHRTNSTRSTTYQHRCQKFHQKWIGEAQAGIGWIFRRDILSLREAVDDLPVQRQVSKIIFNAGKDAVRPLKHCAIENQAKQDQYRRVEEDIAKFAAASW